MKKNRMMRLASFLLVATMLSTSAISGTFAKYTTQDTAFDNARVAKWGVVLQAEGDLYGTKYLDGTQTPGGNTATTGKDNISVSGVQIADDANDAYTQNNVVAPGTKNEEGFKFTVEGKPEVRSKVTLDVWSQNIYLAAGEYGVMVMYGDDGKMTQDTYNSITSRTTAAMDTNDNTYSNKLYIKNNDSYIVANGWDANTAYYTLEDYVNLGSNAYYPVQYKLSDKDAAIYDGTSAETSVDTLAKIAHEIAKKVDKNATEKTLENGELTDATDVVNTHLSAMKNKDVVAYNQLVTNTGTAGAPVNYYEPNTNLATALELEDCVLTWEWKFERGTTGANNTGNAANMTDKADTILGNLMAERVEGTTGDSAHQNTWDTSSAQVVVISNTEIKAPVEFTDYCLDTQFGIDITVSQVD